MVGGFRGAEMDRLTERTDDFEVSPGLFTERTDGFVPKPFLLRVRLPKVAADLKPRFRLKRKMKKTMAKTAAKAPVAYY